MTMASIEHCPECGKRYTQLDRIIRMAEADPIKEVRVVGIIMELSQSSKSSKQNLRSHVIQIIDNSERFIRTAPSTYRLKD